MQYHHELNAFKQVCPEGDFDSLQSLVDCGSFHDVGCTVYAHNDGLVMREKENSWRDNVPDLCSFFVISLEEALKYIAESTMPETYKKIAVMRALRTQKQRTFQSSEVATHFNKYQTECRKVILLPKRLAPQIDPSEHLERLTNLEHLTNIQHTSLQNCLVYLVPLELEQISSVEYKVDLCSYNAYSKMIATDETEKVSLYCNGVEVESVSGAHLLDEFTFSHPIIFLHPFHNLQIRVVYKKCSALKRRLWADVYLVDNSVRSAINNIISQQSSH